MLTDTIIEHDAWGGIDIAELAETAARAALLHLGLDPEEHEIALLACDDARIAELNAEFRDRPAPTNVLSWPESDLSAESEGDRPDPPEPGNLGDIAMAWETCLREAEAGGIPLDHHLVHLVVHAALHLLGYDHQRDGDASLMEGLETDILCKLGVPDPYAADAGAPPAHETGQTETDG